MARLAWLLIFALSGRAFAGDDGKSGAERVLSKLEKVGAALLAAELPAGANEVRVAFVSFPSGDPWELGVLRAMRVHAPYARMVSVVEDVPAYVGLFQDLLVAESTPLPGTEGLVLRTETRIPIPLIANDRTSVRYRADKSGGRRVAQASLVESNHLAGFEGASLLVPLGANDCAYLQVNFVKVGFGAARALPPRLFWVENALGGVQADWALKLRAEQPGIKSAEALEKSRAFARGREDAVKAAFEKPLTLDKFLDGL